MKRFLAMMILVLGVMFQAPAFALDTPPLVEALSSARAGVGNVITDGNGQPYYDGNGRPLSVLDIQTAAVSQSAASIAGALRVPVGDLFTYASRLGMSLPLLMHGTQTTVTRSDGGVEQVFVFKVNGHEYAFMADKTGSNVFGVRMANVDATGMGRLMTAHGLNGNFTDPPWYLSPEAKKDYWIAWGQEQIYQLPEPTYATLPNGLTRLSTVIEEQKAARVADHRVLSRGQRAVMTQTRR